MAARPARLCRHLLAMLGVLVACSIEPLASTPTPPPVSPAPDEPAPPALDPILARLAARAVHHDDFARVELYSWTTVEQLRRLRESKQLLVADANTGGITSPFNRALLDLERDGSEVAELATVLVEHPALRRHRYAWPSPFATTMGLGPRRYGDSLIRIELADEGWIGRFEPWAAEPFAFVDMRGQPVKLADVLAEPERIAAIYHLRGPPELPIAYREFVICSEAMIRTWSVATPEIRARVDDEIELLERLAAGPFAGLPRLAVFESAAADWAETPATETLLSLWHASLAFDNERYRPSRAKLEAIAEVMRGYEVDGGPPLVHPPPPSN